MNGTHAANPAETYERYFVPAMFWPWATVLLRHAAARTGERVLDVACGTGAVARQAAPRVGPSGQVVAVDRNPGMIAVARALPVPTGAAIEWLEADATALPFQEAAFDLVLCQHGLPFVPDRAAAVREMRRVVAPGGRALAIVLQSLARHPVFEALMASVACHLSLPLSAVMTPFALCDADELGGLFSTAAFETVAVLAESATIRFPDAARFVPLAATSSAAAVPAFLDLAAPARAALLEAVRVEVEPVLRRYRDADVLTFQMFAHVAVATT